MLLARAPGRLGEYLGLTGHRMGPGDAIRAGFADHFVPEAAWPALAARLVETGDPRRHRRLRGGRRRRRRWRADAASASTTPSRRPTSPRSPRGSRRATGATAVLKTLPRQSPLSMACTLELVRAARREPGHREGARARVPLHLALHQRRRPARGHPRRGDRQGPQPGLARHDGQPAPEHVAAMLAPLGPDELVLPAPRPEREETHGDRLHRTGQHGRADGAEPRRGRPRGHRLRRGRGDASRASRRPPRAAAAAARARRGHHHAAGRRHPARGLRRDRAGRRAPARSSSTARPSTSRAPAPPPPRPRPRACSAVDAPVSGGTAGAAAGTLTFMAGGTRRRPSPRPGRSSR